MDFFLCINEKFVENPQKNLKDIPFFFYITARFVQTGAFPSLRPFF